METFMSRKSLEGFTKKGMTLSKRRAGWLVCLLVLSTLSTVIAYADPDTDWWPMFRHDLTHTGYSTSKAPDTNNVLWSYTTGSFVDSSPAVADGKVYVGSSDDKVYCLDAATGSLMWSYPTGYWVRSSPAVADGKVYVGSSDDKVYCLDAISGSLVWSFPTGGDVWSSPAVADGKVYVGSWDNNVYCLDAVSGSLVWGFPIGGGVLSSPAVADGKVYVGSWDNNVYCLDAATGSLIWSYPTGSYVSSSPAVADGKVYVSSWDNNVYCLDAVSGSLVWSFPIGGGVVSSPAVADGKVYVGSRDWNVYCLDAATGTLIWSYTTGDGVFSSPAVADGKVYVGSYDYNVYCLDAATGSLIWSYPTGSNVYSSPAVAIGKVYVGSYDGKVYCFADEVCVISDFDAFFATKNVRIVYPSDSTEKPLGCGAAMVSDWLAAGYVYSRLGVGPGTVTEGLDTNSDFVDQTTGRAKGPAGTGIVSFGGGDVNLVVMYAESDSTPEAERAPMKTVYSGDYIQFHHRTRGFIVDLPLSEIGGPVDYFVIEVFGDGSGRSFLFCYGLGWKGTLAAGKYFDKVVYPNLSWFDRSWILVKWEDTNGDGFVNLPGDGDTYTPIDSGY